MRIITHRWAASFPAHRCRAVLPESASMKPLISYLGLLKSKPTLVAGVSKRSSLRVARCSCKSLVRNAAGCFCQSQPRQPQRRNWRASKQRCKHTHRRRTFISLYGSRHVADLRATTRSTGQRDELFTCLEGKSYESPSHHLHLINGWECNGLIEIRHAASPDAIS